MASPPYLKLSYDRKRDLLSSQWLRVVNSKEYRQAILRICKQLQKSNASGWLIDISRMATLNMSDQHWTIEMLGHELPQTKLRKLALVLPDDLFLEVVVEKVSNSLLHMFRPDFQIAHFSDPTAAQKWLISSNDPYEGLFSHAS
ncbi:STAS/SEC14 domain-containing protein [Pontibacter ramchanderi]|uniref:SpoIIAA-like protein n=1 Tax=Pontibacter ramchanderi TaxID=1179743 RepID=A0A2N3V0J6_9BACT|nr:STAS/SEC14 domain-containing protein [Pontibacter ramchanderi]PKV75096.1 SpoIIAA-like protein [Pontibacter ramchanderi]